MKPFTADRREVLAAVLANRSKLGTSQGKRFGTQGRRGQECWPEAIAYRAKAHPSARKNGVPRGPRLLRGATFKSEKYSGVLTTPRQKIGCNYSP